MYQVLHFEDWTNDLTIATLDQKGLPHVGRVIKVFATKSDPRGVYRRPDLRVLPVPDEEFTFSEQYDYPNRNYNGHELEADLNRLSLDDVGKISFPGYLQSETKHGQCVCLHRPNLTC